MAFCPKCGKEIKEGEVCSCGYGKKPVINQEMVNEQVNNAKGNVKSIISSPAQGVGNFVKSADWVTICTLAVVQTVVLIIFRFLNMIKSNINYSSEINKSAKRLDMSRKEYLKLIGDDGVLNEFGDFIKEFIQQLLISAAVIALTAVIAYFAFKLIKKIEISWKNAFAIGTITALVTIPVTVINEVISLFLGSVRFFMWVVSTLNAFESVATVLMFYFAFNAFEDNSKLSTYATCALVTVLAFADRFVYFIVSALF